MTGRTGMAKRWPEGLPESLAYPDMTVADVTAAAAARYGDAIAVVDGDEILSFVELDARAAAFAHALRGAGVDRGHDVLLHLSNNLRFLVAYYGALQAGASVTLGNPLTPVSTLHAQLVDVGTVVVVTQDPQLESLLEAREGTAVHTVVLTSPTRSAPAERSQAAGSPGVVTFEDFTGGMPTVRPEVPGHNGSDIAHIAFTGGTTGIPKGVQVLHRNVIANVTQMVGHRAVQQMGFNGREVTFTPLVPCDDPGLKIGEGVMIAVSPLYHAQGLIQMNFLLLCGGRIVLGGRFDPAGLLREIEKYRATWITGGATMWQALLAVPDIAERDLSALRVCSAGAGPLDPSVQRELAATIPSAVVCPGYGMTEATCVVSAGPVVRGSDTPVGSVGVPMFDTDVEVRSVDDPSVVLPQGETGELWIRGPQVTAGYRNEELSDQFVDGWLRSGDLGRFSEEGYLYIVGRSKEMLIYKGYNVYPRELEEVLLRHPAIAEAAVVGRPDVLTGQEPVAFVVPRRGFSPDPDEILAYVAEKVLPYKKVRAVYVRDSLPATPTGKVLKRDLEKIVAEDAAVSASSG
ncbi:AMP-binding protein [Pseudonocardia sp. RS11V-5]|uniref:class I adenylate-forming enzyme family protein n=1 Tax=Pseudonocardia terrae TaxID=2905831 RepID=UPI001E65D1BC|nr:AMP-binding protein [Pseudonocardia terrae]MCE3555923.1 AMP-binding protein [Pseudonocardia terrae]